MRILHTESSLGWGGQEIRILGEAAGLIARGHEVELAAPPQARITGEAARFGVPVTPLPIARKGPRGVLALRRMLRARPFAVVNTHSSTDSWLAALACLALAGAPPIVRTRHISAPVGRGAGTRWLYARAAARVVTTGESLRQALVRDLRLPPAHVVSIPTGVDTARFAPGERAAARAATGLPADAPIVGIVATLRSWKGHRFLLEALPALADLDARLVIVGDGPQRPALEAQVRELDLAPRVRFAGNRDDVVAWLRAFDAFVLPSYANEGVPQALMQAMAVGLPCVTTAAGAIPELARDEVNALVVPARDPAALAAALRRVLGEPGLARRLGERARGDVIEAHGWARMLDRMEALFAEVSGARQGATAAGHGRAA